MPSFRPRFPPGVLAAMTASATIGAQFVVALSSRDAVFLSRFEPTALPLVMIGSSIVSILLVAIGWSSLRRIAPSTHVPLTFALSAALIVIEWSVMPVAPDAVTRIFYLHAAGLGPLLGSGFWLVAGDRFDPRTARKHFGQIGGAQTLGGLAGGLVAASVASEAGVAAMLPLLALLQAACGWQVYRLARSTAPATRHHASPDEVEVPSAWQVLARAPYLRSLAALILLGTAGAAFVEYAFKVEAAAGFETGAALGQFFSLYYGGVQLLTFALQTFGSRPVIEKLGLAAAAGSPSLVLALGSIVAIFVPGLWTLAITYGGERVSRGSLLRTGYEQFFTPLSQGDRRAVKATIDVGVGRGGDILGAAALQIVVAIAVGSPLVLLLSIGIGCSVLALVAARSLTRGYVRTLEDSLRTRAVEIDLADVEDTMTRTLVLRSAGRALGLPAPAPAIGAESDLREIASLRSGDAAAVRGVLSDPEGLRAALVPHVIPLLAWDEVAQDAIRALRSVAEERVGELVDALIDPNQPFAVRRRLARVFSICVSQRAVDGVLLGLDDLRFEVRFQCGRSLAAIVNKNPRVRIDEDLLLGAVRKEVTVSRSVWEGRQLLDAVPGPDEVLSEAQQVINERASQSLAHVFTLLSTVLPTEPLRLAFHALHTADPRLRGTALEYLDAVLPHDIRDRLWPFLEVQPGAHPAIRGRDEIVADLLRSNQSITLKLTAEERGGVASDPRHRTR